MSEKIELESLVGEHELSGAYCDSISEPHNEHFPSEEEKQVLRFTLDGENYEAVENPDDGYRSSLQCVRRTDERPLNRFPAIKVTGRMKVADEENGPGVVDDILQFVTERGDVIIEIGTTDVEDYYPGYVGTFAPQFLP